MRKSGFPNFESAAFPDPLDWEPPLNLDSAIRAWNPRPDPYKIIHGPRIALNRRNPAPHPQGRDHRMTEPTGLAPPHDLDALRIDVLRRAVRIYLEHAHPTAPPPVAVQRRLDWLEAAADASALACPPFERVARTDGEGTSIYALRLGNHHYPHMKLQVQPWPNPSGFLLSVNTHDQVLALDPTAADAEAFRSLQAENQRLKEEIEAAWDAAGLPTFLRYLRDYIQAQPSQDDSSPTP